MQNKHMSHKVKGLSRNEKGSLSLGSYRAAKNSVLSVLRQVTEATVAHLLLNKSEYPKYCNSSSCLTIKGGYFLILTERTLSNRQ